MQFYFWIFYYLKLVTWKSFSISIGQSSTNYVMKINPWTLIFSAGNTNHQISVIPQNTVVFCKAVLTLLLVDFLPYEINLCTKEFLLLTGFLSIWIKSLYLGIENLRVMTRNVSCEIGDIPILSRLYLFSWLWESQVSFSTAREFLVVSVLVHTMEN